MRADIKQILIDGVKNHKGKSQISQDIFDRMTGHNRDFQKIADTEIQNAMNNSYLLDEVHNSEEGGKVYFQRVEVIDSNTCKFCKKMHGVIVLWSDHPLLDDKIKDPIADFAIWDGKDWDGQKDFIANGAFHPYCRGMWTRYYDGAVDALIAHTKNQSEIYDRAIDTAREEFKEKGIKNPNETTPGFTQRVEELYNQKNGNEEVNKSLTWSGYELEGRYKFAGFNISVENKKGSIRSGTDKDGHEWHCKMHFDYGYIRGTEGVDGDHVDVYIGDDEEAKSVYIVHQNNPTTGKYDEDKVMLGFPSLHDAREAYLKQYDRPGFLGKADIMPLEEFREKVLSKKYRGKMVKSFSERIKELTR
jgi:SPP1 gp7 family putative phage head morphogenesis protein